MNHFDQQNTYSAEQQQQKILWNEQQTIIIALYVYQQFTTEYYLC